QISSRFFSFFRDSVPISGHLESLILLFRTGRVAGEHEEAEGEVPDRPVRAGSQGRRRRRRRWAGRVAQPRRHARLRRRHHRRADHRQRRAPGLAPLQNSF
ncbi:Os10g0395200, partial [Oryza sativa Japonica Group]